MGGGDRPLFYIFVCFFEYHKKETRQRPPVDERYGRRPTILLMIFLEVPLAIAAAFSTDYITYTSLRVVSGLFFPALYQLPFILALELMPPSRRTYTGIVVSMLFAGGMCALSLLAYCFRDWYKLSLATSLPFISLYSYFWLIPESPRWLVGRGRIAEAEKVLWNIAKKNGINLKRGLLLQLHKKVKEEEAEAEAIMLSAYNGHITVYPDIAVKDDRPYNQMLTFKPDISKMIEVENEANNTNLDKITALKDADMVDKKSKLKIHSDNDDEMVEISPEIVKEEETILLAEQPQNFMETDTFNKSPLNTLRRKSIQMMSKFFHHDDDDDEADKRMDDQNSEGDGKASPLDIFRYPNIRKRFFILTFDWVALGVVYNSLSYNTPNLGVDDYLAFFIGGVVELPSYCLAWRCMDRYGRRWVLFTFMTIGGVACLSCVLVPESMPWVTVSLAMLGRLCAAASFAVFYVLIGELLPTVLRSQAMGASSFISGLGLLACPYIVHLATYFKTLPLCIMGILCLTSGVASLFLPETLRRPLPQTLNDAELFGRDFKILSCVETEKKNPSVL
ncbi:Organic cation transporter 1 [Eumeta japonica]|uniref:Organic cation transporter 1 n=1 Tax=Eumeta variegata TaxID=151549 RepID=A0A4C1U3L8_EUMVA|nr:Organic cation transporter 1 [Eumeta japonica]